MCLIQYAPDAPNATWMGEYRIAKVTKRKARHNLYALELEDCSGWREVLYLAPVDEFDDPLPPVRGQIVQVKVTGTQATHGGWYDRVDMLKKASAATALRLFPSRWCPKPHTLTRLYERLEVELQHPALRQFVDRVFEDQRLARAFLTLPGSKDCHHAEPGGLLAHSLELVEHMAALATRCDPLMRDCLLVVALFHDIGKAAPQVLQRTPYWQREHPLMNKMLLEEALLELRRHDESAWSTIYFLLDVLAGATDGKRIPEAELLVALDRVNAATDARERAQANADPRARVMALQPYNGGPKRLFYRSPVRHPPEAGDTLPPQHEQVLHSGTS